MWFTVATQFAKCFIDVINRYINPVKSIILSPFYRIENWDKEGLWDALKSQNCQVLGEVFSSKFLIPQPSLTTVLHS